VLNGGIVTATQQGTMRLWCLSTGELLQLVQALDQDSISCMKANEQGIWTGSLNGVIRCWDPLSLRPILTVSGHKGKVLWIELGEDPIKDPFLSSGLDNSVRVWWKKNTRTSSIKKKLFGHK